MKIMKIPGKSNETRNSARALTSHHPTNIAGAAMISWLVLGSTVVVGSSVLGENFLCLGP